MKFPEECSKTRMDSFDFFEDDETLFLISLLSMPSLLVPTLLDSSDSLIDSDMEVEETDAESHTNSSEPESATEQSESDVAETDANSESSERTFEYANEASSAEDNTQESETTDAVDEEQVITEEISDDTDTSDLPTENNDTTITENPDTSKFIKIENNGNVSRKRPLSDDEDTQDDGKTCPICLDYWTNSGDHRLCSLKCGHLFGYSCVERWISNKAKKTCPTCKKKVTKTEIRFLYARKLIAVDTHELDEMRATMNSVIEEKNKVQMEISKVICREHSLVQEIKELNTVISRLKNNKNMVDLKDKPNVVPKNQIRFYMDKGMEICSEGGARVFDVSHNFNIIMATVKSPNRVFSYEYGLRKIDISTYKSVAFLPLHTKIIRDVSFCNNNVLTVSADQKFKIIEPNQNTTIGTGTYSTPLWSCCWDRFNPSYFYVGTQMGSVLKYDMRNLNVNVETLSVAGDMSPVVSLAHVPQESGYLPNDGILTCKLNSLHFFENCGTEYSSHPLNVAGPFFSMRYNNINKLLLISSRPNSATNYVRHTLSSLKMNDSKVNAEHVYTFQGGHVQRLMSRSHFIKSNLEYVAAYDESAAAITLWNVSTGFKASGLPARDPVLDINNFTFNNSDYLVALTSKKLEFFKLW